VIPKRAPLVDPTARSFAKAPPGSAGSWLSDNASVIPERIALSNARRVVVKVLPHPLIRSTPSDERSNSLGLPLMWETETHTSFRIWGPRDFFGARVPPWYLPTPPHAE